LEVVSLAWEYFDSVVVVVVEIVGLVGTRISIWRRNGQRSIFPSRAGTFPKGLCMRYVRRYSPDIKFL